MTGPEQGFLLLSSHLGNPTRKVLTTAQLRKLGQCILQANFVDPDQEVTPESLVSLGYDRSTANRIFMLLSETEVLNWYVSKGQQQGIFPITRITKYYPPVLKKALGLDAPGCLWAKGDASLLSTPMISLVGSRELAISNRFFAREVGRQAALQGYTLISGNARGADQEAQEACLAAGGKVISIVADRLDSHACRENVLFLSEDGFDLGFSTIRALSRNRVIHTLGKLTLVAQCSLGIGGTWDGTTKNLRYNWSPVFCFDDGSAAAAELACRGAVLIDTRQLADFSQLQQNEQNFIDQ